MVNIVIKFTSVARKTCLTVSRQENLPAEPSVDRKTTTICIYNTNQVDFTWI